MAKIISLFNHKGGVSKTTTAFHLGWKMAEKNKKVLLVDLDSQCNLTGMVLGWEDIDGNDLKKFYSNPDNLTMQKIVNSIIDGKTSDTFVGSEKGKFLKTGNPNLCLLAGHLLCI